MTTAQSKGVKNFFQEKYFLNSDFRNWINNYSSVTPPMFAMFHPQTTEIQPFKVDCFSKKRSNFNMMTLLSMMPAQISKFCSVCGIDSSWAFPVQTFTLIRPFITEIHCYQVYLTWYEYKCWKAEQFNYLKNTELSLWNCFQWKPDCILKLAKLFISACWKRVNFFQITDRALLQSSSPYPILISLFVRLRRPSYQSGNRPSESSGVRLTKGFLIAFREALEISVALIASDKNGRYPILPAIRMTSSSRDIYFTRRVEFKQSYDLFKFV